MFSYMLTEKQNLSSQTPRTALILGRAESSGLMGTETHLYIACILSGNKFKTDLHAPFGLGGGGVQYKASHMHNSGYELDSPSWEMYENV